MENPHALAERWRESEGGRRERTVGDWNKNHPHKGMFNYRLLNRNLIDEESPASRQRWGGGATKEGEGTGKTLDVRRRNPLGEKSEKKRFTFFHSHHRKVNLGIIETNEE